jgi:hypothetical protein
MALPAFSSPAATTDTLVYTVPAGKNAAVSINVAALLACTAKIAITGGTAPGASHWLESGRALGVGDTMERSGVYLGPGCRVYINSSVANGLSAQVYGIEESV